MDGLLMVYFMENPKQKLMRAGGTFFRKPPRWDFY